MPLFKGKSKKDNQTKTGSLQNPKILDVNLIKDEAQVSFDWSKNFLFLGLVLGLAFILVVEIYLGLDWWVKQEDLRLQVLTSQTDSLNAATAKLRNEAAAAVSYKDRALIFSSLLDSHIYWSAFFAWLERNTLSTVKYQDFSGDLSGVYELQAQAPSYSEAAWQASLFLKDPLVKRVSIKEVSADSDDLTGVDNVSFAIYLELDPNIFKK